MDAGMREQCGFQTFSESETDPDIVHVNINRHDSESMSSLTSITGMCMREGVGTGGGLLPLPHIPSGGLVGVEFPFTPLKHLSVTDLRRDCCSDTCRCIALLMGPSAVFLHQCLVIRSG